MKKTQEILGLPIISVSDGNEAGKVKGIIINADTGNIDYIVVDSGTHFLNIRVISTGNILGVGEYALTIEGEGVVNDINQVPSAVDLLQKDIQVRGTKVLTKKGRLIGEIGDIYVDEDDDFRIIGLEYIADITQKRIRLIPRESVITFGKNLIVVVDGIENALLDRPGQLTLADRSGEDEKKNSVSSDLINQNNNFGGHTTPAPSVVRGIDANTAVAGHEPYAMDVDTAYRGYTIQNDAVSGSFGKVEPVVEDVQPAKEDIYDYQVAPGIVTTEETTESPDYGVPEEVLETIEPIAPASEVQTTLENAAPVVETFTPVIDVPQVPAVADEAPSEKENSAASLFEQRQRQYLMGRKATKTITDPNGNVIVSEGMTINGEIIDDAKLSGKLIELVMNNKA